jgi:DNA helicase II / ATP-dependent DNA helicase PcrA
LFKREESVMSQISQKIYEPYKRITEIFSHAPIAEIGSPLTSVDLVNDSEDDAFYFRCLEQNGIKLNENQIKAVRSINGPLLIIAGAGSGKTSVLVSRIGYMLAVKEIDPSSILLVTFTRKAAAEMTERIGKLPGITPRMKRQLSTGTFHSIFLQILRKAGYTQKILSSERQQHSIIKRILKEMDIQEDYQPESILALISYCKNQMIRPSDIDAKTPIDKEFKEVYKRYENWKEDNEYMDFDDILIETYYLLKYNPAILAFYQKQFQYIMVDEFQDTSFIQYELIKMLALPQNNLCVVGDDAQTIYGFRGASSSYILNFHREFPNTKQVILDINYRSTESIVGLGNEIIKHNKKQIKKTLKSMKPSIVVPYFSRPKDTNEEARQIVDHILMAVNSGEKEYRDFAVLFRTNAVSRAIYDELVMRKVPFVYYGKDNNFYENSFVKPIVDILRLVIDPNNEDAILSVAPVFYLKRDDVLRCLDHIRIEEEQYQKTHSNKLQKVFELLTPNLKPFQQDSIKEKMRLIQQFSKTSPYKAIQIIREGKAFGYDKFLEMNKRKTLTLHKEMVKEMLDEVESSAKQYETIQQYIDFIDEISRINKGMENLRKDEHANAVKLMTIHASKGLEFDTVFLMGFIENVLPHKAALNAAEQEDRVQQTSEKTSDITEEAIEEERRLAYVAITRAKESLYLSAPRIYHEKEADISRFLLEALS